MSQLFYVLILIHIFMNNQPIFMFNVSILMIFCETYEYKKSFYAKS